MQFFSLVHAVLERIVNFHNKQFFLSLYTLHTPSTRCGWCLSCKLKEEWFSYMIKIVLKESFTEIGHVNPVNLMRNLYMSLLQFHCQATENDVVQILVH